MTEQLVYLDRFRLLDGKMDDFKRFATDLTEFVEENEPGAVSYDYFLDEDGNGTAVFVFKDAEAMDLHIELASSRFMEGHQMLQHSEIELLGSPSDQALQMASSFSATVKQRLVGFTR